MEELVEAEPELFPSLPAVWVVVPVFEVVQVLHAKVELWVWAIWLTLSAKTLPIPSVVEDEVVASVGGIIIPLSSFWGASSLFFPDRFNGVVVSGISDSFVGTGVFSGKVTILILILVGEATTTLVITAKSPITIAVVLIGIIWLNTWEIITPFTIVVIKTFSLISTDILITVTFLEEESPPISNSQSPIRFLATS